MAAKHLKPWIWQRPEWPEFHWDSAPLLESEEPSAYRRVAVAADSGNGISGKRLACFGLSSGRSYIVRAGHAQIPTERDTDDVSNPCSFRSASAARSPMMMQGAMVLPVVTRGMIEPSAMRRFSTP